MIKKQPAKQEKRLSSLSGLGAAPEEANIKFQIQNLSPEDERLVRYCKFYMALIMNEILKETPINEICQ
jgi:hypothetical protein